MEQNLLPDQSPFISKKELTIILADDDEDDTDFVKDVIKDISPDIKISTASDGLKLLELLSHSLPDIIFLDLNMPRMDGIICLRRIRQQKSFDRIPVIIYSTNADSMDIDLSYSLGASLYIRKTSNIGLTRKQMMHVLSMSIASLIPQCAKRDYVVSYRD